MATAFQCDLCKKFNSGDRVGAIIGRGPSAKSSSSWKPKTANINAEVCKGCWESFLEFSKAVKPKEDSDDD